MKKKQAYGKTPAACRAVVRDGKIALRQVFTGNEPIRVVTRSGAQPESRRFDSVTLQVY